LAVPIVILVCCNAGLAYWLNRNVGVEWWVADAALATVAGGSEEVPVMLSVVHIVRHSRSWYERA
jgi:ACR3 family arsenite transporter